MRSGWGRRGFALAMLLSAAGCPTPAEAPRAERDLPGFDTRSFTVRERREFASYGTDFLAPCPELAVTLRVCVEERRACPLCEPALRYVFDAVREGRTRSQIEEGYETRFAKKALRDIPLAGSPVLGPEGAPVVVVEFADFECPSCRAFDPHLKAILKQHGASVRLVFKFLPLAMHRRAEPAARAAIAAFRQGKFWQYEEGLFSLPALEDSDLVTLARSLSLDMDRFEKDLSSEETNRLLAEDRALADTLKVRGTPAVYVGGREVLHLSELEEYIDVERKKQGKHP